MSVFRSIGCWLLLIGCAAYARGNDYEESLRHYRSNDMDSALYTIDRAIDDYKQRGRVDSLVLAFTHKALVYAGKFGLVAAQQLMDSIMPAVARLPGGSVARVAAYTRMGQLAVQRYELSQARRYFKKAEESVVEAQPANRHYVILYHAIAQLHLAAQQYERAQHYALKAYRMNLQVEGRDGALMANIWQTRYYVSYYRGDYNQALPDGLEFQRLVPLHYPSDHPNTGMMHNSLSDLYYALDLPEQALYHQHRAVDIHYRNYVATGNGYTLAGAYSNLGGLYYALHEHYLANEYLTSAKNMLEATFGEFGPGLLETLVMLGSTKQKMGLKEEAEALFEQAYRVQQTYAPDEIPRKAYIESYLGDFYLDQHQFLKAVDYYDRTMANYQRIGEGHSYYSLHAKADKGAALGHMGRWNEAIALQREALDEFTAFFPQLGNQSLSFFDGISITYRNAKQYDKALAYSDSILLKSLALQELPSHPSQWVPRLPYTFNSCTYLLNRAAIWFGVYEQTKEQQPLLNILEIVDAYNAVVAANLYIFRSQASLIEQADVGKQLLSIGIEACWALSGKGAFSDDGAVTGEGTVSHYLEKALEYAERSKALLLRLASNNLMVDAAADSSADGIAARDRGFRIRINSLNEQYLNAEQAVDSLLRLLTTTMEDYRVFQDSLKKAGHESFLMKYDLEPVGIAGIRESLLGNGETLIHYAVTDESVFAFAITAQQFRVHRSEKSVLDDVAALQHLHMLSARQFVPPAYRLYGKLVKPLEPFFNSDRLLIIPDAELYYLNFELLLQHDREKHFGRMPYLVGRYTFSYLLSVSNAIRLRAARSGSRGESGGNGRSGDRGDRGDRGGGGERGAGGARAGRAMLFVPVFTPEMKAAFRKSLPAVGSGSEPYLFLNRQPFSLRAAQRIGQMVDHDLFVEQQAQEHVFKQMAGDYSVLHLGTHAEVTNQSPLQSRLFFAKSLADTVHMDDGYLYAYEIYAMHLRAELAVLTACETGSGALRRGEGVVSLAHSFMHAGCSSVVMALWKIDEKTNADLISRFYEYLSAGMDKSEALRKAKLQAIQESDAEMSHPYYWAGLVLIGDSTPIYRNYTHWYWIVGVIVLSGIGLLFARRKKRFLG